MQKATPLSSCEEKVHSRFTFVENTMSNSPKVLRAKFLGSDGLLCFSRICKFGSVKNPFAIITSLSELYFRFRGFILLIKKKKKRFLWTMAAGQAGNNHGNEWGLTWYLKWGICTWILNSNLNPITKFTCSSRGTEFKDILPRNMSEMITKTIPIRIAINYAVKQNILFWIYWKVNWDNNMIKIYQTETTTWSEFTNGVYWKAVVEQILTPKERKKSKRAGLSESKSGIRVENLTNWVKSFDIEKL